MLYPVLLLLMTFLVQVSRSMHRERERKRRGNETTFFFLKKRKKEKV